MNGSDIARRGVLGLASAIGAAAAFGEAEAAGRSAIDAYIRERMAAKGIPGAVVAIVREGRPVRVAAFGKASLEFDIAADVRTVFPMASASKIFAGLTAAMLMERGKLDLDAPMRQYIPEFGAAYDGVRVYQLLSHTSGLGGLGGNPAYAAEAKQREDREQYVDERKLETFTPAELIAYGASVPLQEPPGSRWRYSQYPYFLFGQIVKRVSGVDYDAFVTSEILHPLGMLATVYGDHRTVVARRVSTNYTRQFGPLQNYALKYTPGYWSAAGLNTSASDVARLFGAFEPGLLVSRAGLDRLWAKTRLTDGREVDYGRGFALGDRNGRAWAGHEGGGCCYVSWFPQQRLGIAILLNLSGSHEDGIDLEVADRVFA